MPIFNVNCKLVFEGRLKVNAETKEEAENIVCDSLMMKKGEVSTFNDKQIVDCTVEPCGYPDFVDVE